MQILFPALQAHFLTVPGVTNSALKVSIVSRPYNSQRLSTISRHLAGGQHYQVQEPGDLSRLELTIESIIADFKRSLQRASA